MFANVVVALSRLLIYFLLNIYQTLLLIRSTLHAHIRGKEKITYPHKSGIKRHIQQIEFKKCRNLLSEKRIF